MSTSIMACGFNEVVILDHAVRLQISQTMGQNFSGVLWLAGYENKIDRVYILASLRYNLL